MRLDENFRLVLVTSKTIGFEKITTLCNWRLENGFPIIFTGPYEIPTIDYCPYNCFVRLCGQPILQF